jgi:hypothetical protein
MLKDIKDYENLYAVSEDGQIFSYRSNRFLKPCRDGNGYYYVSLTKNGQRKSKKIHRIVAETFLENPNNLPCVNHKDCDTNNNNVNNLEWCDYSYNNSYKDRIDKVKQAIIESETHSQKVAIVMCDKKTGEPLKIYKSIGDAARDVNGNHSNIIACIKGRQKTAYGYKWKYLE